MSADEIPAGVAYLRRARELLGSAESAQWSAIAAAADAVAATVASGGTVYAFGTGHSHMLAEELYYRAGGLVRVRPILFEGLMLHANAELSTRLERLSGLAAPLLEDAGVSAGDVVIIASNSGSNATTSELALAARDVGAQVVALTSVAHATSSRARPTTRPRLHEVADIVLDNGGAVGDAAVSIPGLDRAVGPTSTVVGAAMLNAVVVEAVSRLIARGHVPDVYASSNIEDGDDANAHYSTARSVPR